MWLCVPASNFWAVSDGMVGYLDEWNLNNDRGRMNTKKGSI